MQICGKYFEAFGDFGCLRCSCGPVVFVMSRALQLPLLFTSRPPFEPFPDILFPHIGSLAHDRTVSKPHSLLFLLLDRYLSFHPTSIRSDIPWPSLGFLCTSSPPSLSLPLGGSAVCIRRIPDLRYCRASLSLCSAVVQHKICAPSSPLCPCHTL